MIGEGAIGLVYKYTNRFSMNDSDCIVIKRIPLSKCQGFDINEKLITKLSIFAELKFLTSFNHRNLVRYLGVFNLEEEIEIV